MVNNTLIADGIKEMERRIPVWLKGLTLAATLMSFGFIANDFVSNQMDLQPRLMLVEDHAEQAEPLLKYLVCKDLAENTSACIFILRDSRYFEEFSQLGIVQDPQ